MGHVPHLYLPGPWPEGPLPLPDETRHHLGRVLRRSKGSAVTYTDGAGRVGEGRLNDEAVERGSEWRLEPAAPSITLAVAPPRSTDRQRFVVEKLAELGVDHLNWLDTRHGEGRPPRHDKAVAWAVAALEQSRRAHLLEIGDRMVAFADLSGPLLVADEHAKQGVEALEGAVTVAIGPEGGFADEEIPLEIGRIRLSDGVLRTETAAIAAATLLTAARERA